LVTSWQFDNTETGRPQLRINVINVNPLNAELNPICHLLALLGGHLIFHVSRIRVNVVSVLILKNVLWVCFCTVFTNFVKDIYTQKKSSNWALHITHYTLHITHYTLHITHYTLHITHYTEPLVMCQLHNFRHAR